MTFELTYDNSTKIKSGLISLIIMSNLVVVIVNCVVKAKNISFVKIVWENKIIFKKIGRPSKDAKFYGLETSNIFLIHRYLNNNKV